MDNISAKSQKSNIYQSHAPRRATSTNRTFFHLDINPVLGHVLIHSVDKTHALVVTVELIWLLFLNILSFNFVSTLNKFRRLKRFRKSYVNRPDVVLTTHTSYTAFLLDVRCAVQCGHVPFFFQLFVPSASAFA